MARDRANPPLLGQLIQEGVLDDIVNQIVNTYPPGTDIYTTNILYDAVSRNTPALLPSTFNALVNRASQEIQARWEGLSPEDFAPFNIDQIPIEPERTGRAAEETGRILYKITIYVPLPNGSFEPRTIYISSNKPLTLDQIQEEARAGLLAIWEMPLGPPPPGELPPAAELNFVIEEVSRSY